MAERLVSKRLFWQTPVSGVAVSGPISSAVDMRTGVLGLQSLQYVLSSVVSTPDCGFFYATSPDGITWGGFADTSALRTSTFSGGNPQGWHTVPLSNVFAPYARFSVSSTGSNPNDSLCTLDIVVRMSQ